MLSYGFPTNPHSIMIPDKLPTLSVNTKPNNNLKSSLIDESPNQIMDAPMKSSLIDVPNRVYNNYNDRNLSLKMEEEKVMEVSGPDDEFKFRQPDLLKRKSSEINREKEMNEKLLMDFLKQEQAMQNEKQKLLELESIQAAQRLMEEERDKYKDVIEKRKAEEEEATSCKICMMPFDTETKITILENCGHIFCANCLKYTVKASIDDNKFPIICPDPPCKIQMHQTNVESVLGNSKDIMLYRERQMKFYGETNSDISWCPTADCRYMFVYEDGDPAQFNCPICFKVYCIKCKSDWHDGQTCAEYKVNNTYSEADKQFEEFIRGSKFKQCGKCKFWVGRSEGCDHMTCRCGHQFCYRCGGNYPHGAQNGPCTNPQGR